ncbi:MAG: DUF2169 domain-containing protein [Pirellula sp.]|jgi:uncharacterized protein YjbI with pentapeptide repeats|nr:DUF2169 domain-containing protein [Pirellula sp.]
MLVVCDESFRIGWLAHSFEPPAISGVFFAKMTIKLQHDALATVLMGDDALPLMGEVPSGEQSAAPPQNVTDFAPFKPRFDFLVTATAYPPSRVPSTNWIARWQVGTWSKSLRIVGPRKWITDLLAYRITSPLPITYLPLDYRFAFGGPSSKRNPAGRGYGDKAEKLPYIELMDHPVQSPNDDLRPAGFGPIAASWFPRSECLGTYDSRWQQTRWPWYPEDFNYAYFNTAPLDQQFPRPLVGNEVLEFQNMHPEHATYRARLPGLRVRCFISHSEARVLMPAEQFVEVPLCFDTLHVDMNKELATLHWRGNVPVESLKMTEIKTLFMMVESVDAPPQSLAACIDRFRRMRLDQMGMHDTQLDQLTEEPNSQRQFETKMEASNAELEARLREAEAQQAVAKEQAIAAGADPAMFDQPPPNNSPRAAVAEAKASLRQTADSLRNENPALAQQLDKEAATLEEVEAMLPRELNREQIKPMIAARESFANCSLVGLELNGLDFSGLDCSTTDFSKAKLRGAKFTGANLLRAKLCEADLIGANFTGALLDHANFTGAVLQDCVFAAASINSSVFVEQQLVGNDFSNAQGRAANFSRARLLKCNFHSAKLPSSDFTATEIIDSSFERAELKAAQFENVRAQKVRMRGANLSGIHASDGSDFTDASFEQIQAEGSIWQESILDGANFSESKLPQALFTGASLIQAKFDRSDLTKAVLDDANLERASLDQCNLLYASLDRANLSNARMREANIYHAGFWDAKLENLDRRGTSVKGTVLSNE